jgi:shikimate kinase
MMGSGKSTVGRQLASRLGWAFLDSDTMVEAATGSTVAELFESGGEAAFRAEESRVLAEALVTSTPAVVSAAGGSVLSEVNRGLLTRQAMVVWLRAEPSTLATRVRPGGHRPLLGADHTVALAQLDAVRRPLYEEVADVVVDVDDLDPLRVADRILALTAFERSRP